MKKICAIGLTSSLFFGVACGKKSSDDDAAPTPPSSGAVMQNLATGALALMPEIKTSYGLMADWASTDMQTYRNDLAFQIFMRFMDQGTTAPFKVGNENMRSNLDNAKTLMDVMDQPAGTFTPTGQSTAVVVSDLAATAATVSPFKFGVTQSGAFEKVRKITGMDLRLARKMTGTDGIFLMSTKNTSNSGSSEGAGSQYTTVYGTYAGATKDMGLYYASNMSYDSGAKFIIRMDFTGNETSHDFSMKMTLRSLSKPNSEGGAGGFALVSKGNAFVPKAGSTPNWVVIKARQCTDTTAANAAAGYDAANCLADGTIQWFCFNSSATMADWATFVKSGVAAANTKIDKTYTSTEKILFATDKSTLTGTCSTLAAAINDTAFLGANETDVPKAPTTYYSTLGAD